MARGPDWDRNGLNVALVPTELDQQEQTALGAPDRVWLVTGSRDFPDALLDNVFVFDCPALDANRKEAERMALKDAGYLQEVAQAPDERKGWGT